MRVIWVIFKKELGGFFKSPWFLFIFAAFSLTLSVRYMFQLDVFIQSSFMPGSRPPNIHDVLFIPHLNWVYMTFLVLIPLLAMKLIAEEKKERTMDLLLTAPIGSLEIVVGKFLACWAAVTSMILLAFLFPLITSGVSDFDWGPLWGSYVGMIFLAGFNVSLCLVASSLTSSPLLSGFLGFLFMLLILLFGSGGVQSENEIVASIFDQLSLVHHLHDFFQGIFNTKSFVFLISGMSFFCFVTHKIVDASRWK